MNMLEKYLKFHRVALLPKGLKCPITKEVLILDMEDDSPDYVYVAEQSGKRWKYYFRQNVFIETCKSARVYRWYSETGWHRMVVKIFENSFGGNYSTGKKYVKIPETNWDALLLSIANFTHTNRFIVGIRKLWRKIFPKRLLFPLIKNVVAKTVAQDLVSVQPMSGPTGELLYLDYRYKGTEPKPETKRQEHVIIKKQDNPSNSK